MLADPVFFPLSLLFSSNLNEAVKTFDFIWASTRSPFLFSLLRAFFLRGHSSPPFSEKGRPEALTLSPPFDPRRSGHTPFQPKVPSLSARARPFPCWKLAHPLPGRISFPFYSRRLLLTGAEGSPSPRRIEITDRPEPRGRSAPFPRGRIPVPLTAIPLFTPFSLTTRGTRNSPLAAQILFVP